jgi:hypothetical protein
MMARSGKGAVMDQVLGRPVFFPEDDKGRPEAMVEGYFDSDRDTVFLHMK